MNWTLVAQAASDALLIVLVIRLLSLKLHSVYRFFAAFLAFDFVSSFGTILREAVHIPHFDYRIYWMCMRIVAWTFYLCIVYALLHAILLKLPGIYRTSKRVLNITFVLVVALSLLTIRLDVAVSGSTGYLSRFVDPIGKAVRITFDLERVISTVALLVLLLILAFVLWFPVQMPRNLAVFSTGLIVFFAVNTALLLSRGVYSKAAMVVASNFGMFVVAACYAYLALFITARGEEAPVRMGHGWAPEQQQRLIGQLEAMNAALLRTARR